MAMCRGFSGDKRPELKPAWELKRWVPSEAEIVSRMDNMCRGNNVEPSQCSYRQQRAMQFSEGESTVAFSVTTWDANMKTNACLIWRRVCRFHTITGEWRCLVDSSGFIDRQGTARLGLAERRAFCKRFSLSKNGCGLIDTSCERTSAIVSCCLV